MNNEKIRVGISHGDINGIGYEIIIKTLLDNRICDLCTPIVYGSPKLAAYHRKVLNIANFSFNNINTPAEANIKRPNIINCVDDYFRVELGKATPHAGKAAFQALERAVSDLQNGEIDVLVTAPINKEAIQSDEFQFPGHTEYLAEKFEAPRHLMLMVSDKLRVGVATGHVPLREVPDLITTELLLNKLRIINKALLEDFAIRKPKIAVLGLNPHAGDNGLIGNEEKDIIIPAIEAAAKESMIVKGPYPADGFFASHLFDHFDAILAMYHDQGLTPFKTIVPMNGTGVNYTAGLPVVRTSPAHGTAFEITGKNEASPDSFRHAMYQACDIFRNRQQHKELTENQLIPQK